MDFTFTEQQEEFRQEVFDRAERERLDEVVHGAANHIRRSPVDDDASARLVVVRFEDVRDPHVIGIAGVGCRRHDHSNS